MRAQPGIATGIPRYLEQLGSFVKLAIAVDMTWSYCQLKYKTDSYIAIQYCLEKEFVVLL